MVSTGGLYFFYTKNIADYAKHSLKNITKYCEKHNYALQCFNEKFNDDVHPCWNKVASILKLIKKYNYVVWIDSDAIFVAILAHVPLFQYAWLNKAFKIDPDIVYGQTTELLNKYRRGVYKTPADMKNHLKQLAKTNPELAKYLKENNYRDYLIVDNI